MAAYAMVLHALVMGVMAAPRAADAGNLFGAIQQLCSGGTMTITGDGEPSSGGPAQGMPCSLCSLGHAAIDAPAVIAWVVPANIVETVALAPQIAPVRPRLDFLTRTRPRGPPAFV